MNTENTEVQNETEVEAQTLTIPTAYIKLTESTDTEATIIEATPKVNANGKPYINVTLQLAEGRTSHKMWVNSPASAANTLRQLSRAFGITAFAQLQEIEGKKCSISSRFDDFAQRVTVNYINKFNNHSKDVVDLSSLDALAASAPAAPEPVEIADVAF